MQNLIKIKKNNESVGDILRFWRKLKRISQMDLALDVGISSKHLSFVETGRSQASRDLILRIAQELKIPFRHRNAFLTAAGYASEYGEEPFDGEKMEMVRQALERMLDKHEPYPAFVVNTGYKILMANASMLNIINFFAGEDAMLKYDNAYRVIFAEDGLRPYVKDWQKVEHFMIARLLEEAVSTQHPELLALYKEISKLRTNEEAIDFQINDNLPIMSLTLEKNSTKINLFTTITTLGTPLDLTTQELRIELFFPADYETKQVFPFKNKL